MPGVGIIRNAGIIRGRVLYEEIRYLGQEGGSGEKIPIYLYEVCDSESEKCAPICCIEWTPLVFTL